MQAADDWRAAVERIRGDNRSGATALLRQAAEALACAAAGLPEVGPTWRDELADAARRVGAARPAMGALLRLAGEALTATDAPTPEAASVGAATAARRFVQRVDREAPRIARRAAGLIQPGATVITISASSLVERALLAAPAAGRVICLESRPACEGTALAGRLAAAGLGVTLVSDAAGASAVAGAGLVLLGGDTLTPVGLIHKIGTLGLVLAARHHRVPVYALCGGEKWLPSPLRGVLGDGGRPDELLEDPPHGLSIANPYFDLTPLELLDGIVTPTAVMSTAAIGQAARRVRVHPALVDLLDNA